MPAGKMCPKCGKYTFINTPTGRECSKCGYKMNVNPGPGKGKNAVIVGNSLSLMKNVGTVVQLIIFKNIEG